MLFQATWTWVRLLWTRSETCSSVGNLKNVSSQNSSHWENIGILCVAKLCTCCLLPGKVNSIHASSIDEMSCCSGVWKEFWKLNSSTRNSLSLDSFWNFLSQQKYSHTHWYNERQSSSLNVISSGRRIKWGNRKTTLILERNSIPPAYWIRQTWDDVYQTRGSAHPPLILNLIPDSWCLASQNWRRKERHAFNPHDRNGLR